MTNNMIFFKAGKRMHKREKHSRGTLIAAVLLSLALGGVFVFGMQFWHAEIPADLARHEQRIYSTFRISGADSHPKEMIVMFADGSQLDIDRVCIDDAVRGKLESLARNSPVELLIHPNSGTILDMRANGEAIVVFEHAMQKLTRERNGFLILGLLCYACAGAGLITLIKQSIRKQKAQKRRGFI